MNKTNDDIDIEDLKAKASALDLILAGLSEAGFECSSLAYNDVAQLIPQLTMEGLDIVVRRLASDMVTRYHEAVRVIDESIRNTALTTSALVEFSSNTKSLVDTVVGLKTRVSDIESAHATSETSASALSKIRTRLRLLETRSESSASPTGAPTADVDDTTALPKAWLTDEDEDEIVKLRTGFRPYSDKDVFNALKVAGKKQQQRPGESGTDAVNEALHLYNDSQMRMMFRGIARIANMGESAFDV